MTETSLTIVSIHLGGAQTKKTAVVRASVTLKHILTGLPPGPTSQLLATAYANWRSTISCSPITSGTDSKRSAPLRWEAHVSSLGASAQKDADSSLIQTLQHIGPADVICIDAPLILPPCAECGQNSCASYEVCNNPQVHLMLREWGEIRAQKNKKPREPQPYTDRYFEFFCRNNFTHPVLASSHDFEPVLGAGRAPLTMRAFHLQKRIRTLFPHVLMLETSPPIAAMGAALFCGYQPRKPGLFRQDLESPEIRANILRRLENKLWAVRGAGMHQMVYREFSEHRETFLAAMGALSAWVLFNGEAFITQEFLTQKIDNPLQGWAIIPKEIAESGW